VGGSYQGFTWHGFRHTWATWHVQNGTPLDVLQKLGGWSDLRMVMNYAHHAPGFAAGFVGNNRKKV
jgi:integrase